MDGKNVDIIIHDSGVLQYHPEFLDENGQSRVRDIILDGPYFIDPTSSYLQANTYTKFRWKSWYCHNRCPQQLVENNSSDIDLQTLILHQQLDLLILMELMIICQFQVVEDLQLGSSDFTIEGWIYLDSIGASSDRTIIAKWDFDRPGLSEFYFKFFLVMYLE